MTDQIEVQEKVRWEDLEVDEKQIEDGWGLSLLQSSEKSEALRKHLISVEDCIPQKSSWIVDEEQGITEWEEGNEPVPTEYKQGVDYAKPGSESNGFIFGAAVMRGIVLAFGISAEEFADALQDVPGKLEMDYLDTPVLGAVDWREANERLPRINEMVARVNAFCTPSRNNLTVREIISEMNNG